MGLAAKLAREKLLERRESLRNLIVLIDTRTDRQYQIKSGSEPILGFTSHQWESWPGTDEYKLKARMAEFTSEPFRSY